MRRRQSDAKGGSMQLRFPVPSRKGQRPAMRFQAIALLAVGAALCWDAAASGCHANDSSAELSVGGLVFTKNTDVSIQSEDLTITPDNVTVRYVFLNESPNPVNLTIAFPLPDIDLADGANVAF